MTPFNIFANCGTCSTCGCDPCKCHYHCDYAEPVFGIEDVPDNPGVLRFNVNGKSILYDFTPLVQATQTDTSLSLNTGTRTLNFNAERHIDTLTAQDLGSIFHLGDLGDVTTKHAKTGSVLVYERDDSCGGGCVGESNRWHVWNGLDTDNVVNSVSYLTGLNGDGSPVTLGRPTNPNQTYLLGWNGSNQVSYFQPTIATTPPANGYQLYLDTDKNLIAVKV